MHQGVGSRSLYKENPLPRSIAQAIRADRRSLPGLISARPGSEANYDRVRTASFRDDFLVGSCLDVNLDAVHQYTETSFIIREISRVQAVSRTLRPGAYRAVDLPYPLGRVGSGDFFWVRSCQSINSDSVHMSTETPSTPLEILRAKSESSASRQLDRRPMALPFDESVGPSRGILLVGSRPGRQIGYWTWLYKNTLTPETVSAGPCDR
jgi:hypothetical protein